MNENENKNSRTCNISRYLLRDNSCYIDKYPFLSSYKELFYDKRLAHNIYVENDKIIMTFKENINISFKNILYEDNEFINLIFPLNDFLGIVDGYFFVRVNIDYRTSDESRFTTVRMFNIKHLGELFEDKFKLDLVL